MTNTGDHATEEVAGLLAGSAQFGLSSISSSDSDEDSPDHEPSPLLRTYCGKVYGVLEGHCGSKNTHPLRVVEQAIETFVYPETAFEFNEFFEYGF
jgi:hypothetical protein